MKKNNLHHTFGLHQNKTEINCTLKNTESKSIDFNEQPKSLCWQMCTITVHNSSNRQVHLPTSYDIKYGASVLLFFLAHCSMSWISIWHLLKATDTDHVSTLNWAITVYACSSLCWHHRFYEMNVNECVRNPCRGSFNRICFSGCCHIISGQKVTSFKCIFWKPSIWPTALPSDWPTSRLRSLCCELQSKLPLNIWWQRWCNLSYPVLRIAWNVR